MDITQMYMASPDWLKLAFILAPCLTAVTALALWAYVKIRTTPPQKDNSDGFVTYHVDEIETQFVALKE